jgi:hypothetical protein
MGVGMVTMRLRGIGCSHLEPLWLAANSAGTQANEASNLTLRGSYSDAAMA